MRFKPCFIIPIYNHGKTIGACVKALAPMALPIFIIDDGSDTSTVKILKALATHEPLVRLYRLEKNQGKGTAMQRGFSEASDAGYSHALQVDADGQHDVSDIPALLAESKAHPQALIYGHPIFDESIPKVRLYGRYLTHFCVWLETLSFDIKDSMCGFRVYPLASVIPLIERARVGQRMDFDTDIIVRLYWDNVPLRTLPVHVNYPKNGVSHFQMVKDNVRISWMHTRLITGMVWRLPVLFMRSWEAFQRGRENRP
jgi:glycosyltransferase involved in cell wall biosynthesis